MAILLTGTTIGGHSAIHAGNLATHGIITTSNIGSYAITSIPTSFSSITVTSSFDTASNDIYASMRVIRNNSSTYQDGMYIGYGNSGSGITRIFGGGSTTGELIKYATHTYEPGSFRAPIFYDSADTSYYLDPNSTSYLYHLVLSGNSYFRPNTWIQFDGSYGLYWPNNYALHIYPNANGSHGALQINGTKGGWAGIYFNDSANTLMANSNESGFHRQGNGWQFRWTEGTMYVHRSTSGGGTAYTVLDTGNYNSFGIPTKQYIWSRGENLLTNGTGLLGNNTNFSSFTFDGSQAYSSSGSFRYTGQYHAPNTDELMPVNAEKRYRLDFWAKTANGQGAYYAYLNFFDVDGNAIVAPYHMYYPNTLTTLAQTLNPGDTVAYLTSVANWENGGTAGVNTHLRSFIFWNYTNSFGYTYPPQTYSRNWYPDAWNPGAINSGNNTITLRVPWSGPSIAAGTQVSNGSAGGTFKYIALGYTIVPTTWTNYVGIMDGIDYSGSNAGGKFPPGTAAAKLGFLTDYNGSGDTIYLANLFVGVDNDYPIYDRWTGNTRIEKSGAFYGTIFYDSNNGGYYLDPSSTSNLYRVDAVAQMRAPIFYDSQDTNYYLDPNSTSRLGTLNINQLSVYGNTYLGDGNGDEVHINDILRVGATDSGDAHFYFGEGSLAGSDYGMHWYWDSGVNFYWYGRNAGSDTLIMNYTTNDNTYVKWHRHFHMNSYAIHYTGELHFSGGTRFINSNSSYLYFQTDSTSVGGIIVRDGNSSTRGYSGYFDGAGFGLLNSVGNWGVRLNPGNVGIELFYAGDWRLRTGSGGVGVNGNLYTDSSYGYGIVGLYSAERYQGVFAMGDSYKLSADGTSPGSLYGIAWTHTNVGGESKSGLGHQALFMTNGVTQTAIGTGIWTNGLITTTSYGTSANWKAAYDWGNHASAGYLTSLPSHNHDDRYYTEGESDGRYAYKAGAAGQDFSADRLSSYYLRNHYGVSTDHSYGMYFDNGLSSAYGIYRESGAWDHPYPDLRIAFHTGIKLGANSSYNGIRFYTDYDMTTQVMSVNNGSDGLGGGNVYVNNSLQAGSSLRAPIFYDSNDTNYYLDPNSSSKLSSLGLGGISPDARLSVSGDTHISGYIYQGGNAAASSSWGSRTLVSSGNYTTNANTFRFDNLGYGTTWDVRFDSSGAHASHSFRAPIFYDSNDTNYYGDFAGFSYLNQLGLANFQYIGGQTSNGQSNYQWDGADYRDPNQWTARLILRRDNATTGINGSIPSLVIFNNNGANQTTASMVFATNECVTGSNSVNLAGIIAKKESVGNCGGWSAGSLNFFVKNFGARVDSLALTPDGNATFSGIVYSTGYGNSSQWNTAYSWGNHASAGYLTGAHNHDDRYYTESESDSRYIDFTSNQNVTGVKYFLTNNGYYSGSTDSAKLQVYATGANAAFMSFHRGGNYAVNFGLDGDNVMRIGGWSAAADRWVLDMSGNNTVAGSFRAPIFYDSQDTSYYLDPNSTSRLYYVNAPQGYVSVGNPWGTANSAYFPNGITTAGGDNWIYGHTYVGNAPSNGSGHEFWDTGKEYHRSNEATSSHGASGRWITRQSANGNYAPYSFESDYGNHSYGVVARYHISNNGGSDRPSITFSSGYNNTRWSVGYCYVDDQFRITQNMGLAPDGSDGTWGSERFRIDTSGNTYAAIGGTLYANGSAVITSANIGSQSVSYASSAGSVAWTNVSSRPTALSQFTNDLGNYGGFLTSITAHTHAISDISGLQTALDGKQAAGSYAASSHTHDDRYYTESESDTRFARRDADSAISGNLVIGNGTYGSSTAYGNSGARLMFSGSDGDAQGNYYIGTNHENYGGNYSKLELRWHTGIRMGAQPGYGGIRFYDTEDLGTVIFSVGSGDNHVRVLNNLYVGGNLALHAGNYNSYSPTLTGGNASGTWSINVTGSAGSVAWTNVSSRPTALSQFSNDLGNYGGWLTTGGKAADSELIDGIDSSRIVFGDGARASTYVSSMNDPNQKSGFFFKDSPTGQPFGDWWNWMTVAGNSWQSSNNYSFQIAHAFHSDDAYIRRMTAGTAYSWRTLITSGNIGSQSVNYANSAGSATTATTATVASQLNKFGDIYGQDWNAYYIQDKFIASAVYGHSGANRPNLTYDYGVMLSYGETSGPLMQMYFPENSPNLGTIFRKATYRTGWNGNWSTWKTLVEQEGNTCTIVGGNQTGMEIHSNVGYNQDPLTYFLLRGQADTSWKALKIRLTGDAGGQDIEFRRIAENGADARMFYVPRGANQVIFEYQFVQGSDSRLKDNIIPITNSLDKVKSLRGVEFDWNSGVNEGTHDVGLIAQDVEAVLPEAVTTQEDGYKNLAYTKVIPLLVEAMKEQQAMIDALKAEIELLKNK